MDIESEIGRLLALAEPLRALDEADLAKVPLAGIVDEINALRAEQSHAANGEPLMKVAVIDIDPEAPPTSQNELPKRRPGRPRNADKADA